MNQLRGSEIARPIWIGLSVVTLALWAAATILAITLPVVETGTDPTQIPFAAMFAPAAAAVLTVFAGLVSNVFGRAPTGGQLDPRGGDPPPRR
jgi:hypothetical protein